MRDMILFIAIIAFMRWGYFQIGKVGNFIDDNMKKEENNDIVIIDTQDEDIIETYKK